MLAGRVGHLGRQAYGKVVKVSSKRAGCTLDGKGAVPLLQIGRDGDETSTDGLRHVHGRFKGLYDLTGFVVAEWVAVSRQSIEAVHQNIVERLGLLAELWRGKS